MALAIAIDEARANTVRIEGDGKDRAGGVTQVQFLGSKDNPDLPQASLSHRDPGRVSYPHYHSRDQFQVIVDGKGKLGRHDLAPYCVHFARAYTPYGPLSSDPSTPFDAFVLRPHYDPGSHHLPEAHDKLKLIPDRQPWQITRQATFPSLKSSMPTSGVVLQAIPDIADQQGLAAYTLSMQPNAKTQAPDPAHGDGQYLLVVNGSLLNHNKEYGKWALVYVSPEEGPFQVNAGATGLEAFVLNFPRAHKRAIAPSSTATVTTGLRAWQCVLCSFFYDETNGLPEEGIAPGTRWEAVPEAWTCPDCGASKSDFEMIEVQNSGSASEE